MKKSILYQMVMPGCITLVLASLNFVSCKNKIEAEASNRKEDSKAYSVVKPPFSKVDVSFVSFKVDPTVDNVLKTESGSIIEIKANSLVDESGLPLKGECVLRYREFMDPAEILVAGIPMSFKDKASNTDANFVSAGMFEIRAEHALCANVGINSKSPIKVKLATNTQGDDFSNFYLNTTTGEWVYTGQGSKFPNPEKLELNKKITSLKKKVAFHGKDYVAFSAEALMDAYLNEDYEAIYKFFEDTNRRIPRRVLNYGIKDLNIYCNQYVLHRGVERPASMWLWQNINKAKFPKDDRYLSVRLDSVSPSVYEVVYRTYPGDSLVFKAKLKIVMALEHMFKFSPEYWSSNSKEAMEEIHKQEKVLANMRDLYRELQVSSFGIFNCDKFYGKPESFEVLATISVPSSQDEFVPREIFYVSKKDKALIKYKITNKTVSFMFDKDASASLYTILPGNNLAEIDQSQLMGLNGAKGEITSAKLKFKLKSKINSPADLKRELNM